MRIVILGWATAFVTLGCTTGAYAQSLVSIEQIGESNHVSVDQSGSLVPSEAQVTQLFASNSATIVQANNGRSSALRADSATIVQRGGALALVEQTTPVNQIGSVATVFQGDDKGSSPGNSAIVQQDGGGHSALVDQQSRGNAARILQNIDPMFLGLGGEPGWRVAEIRQLGDGGHAADIEQSGPYDTLQVTQTGWANSIRFRQPYSASTGLVEQSGSNNRASVVSPWYGNATIVQRGVGGSVEVDGLFANILQTETSAGALARAEGTRGPWAGVTIEQHGAGIALISSEAEQSSARVFQQEASTAHVYQGSFLGSINVEQFEGSSGALAIVGQATRGGVLIVQQHDASRAEVNQSGLGPYTFVSQGPGALGALAITNQTGLSNHLALFQRRSPGAVVGGPAYSVAEIDQIGYANNSLVFQQGARAQFVEIRQVVDRSEASSWQGGAGLNTIQLVQGSDNYAQLGQGGRPDTSLTPLDPVAVEYPASHANTLVLVQSGQFNSAVLTQLGSFDSIQGEQSGIANWATVLQEAGGQDNRVTFWQTGMSNVLDILQSGMFNSAEILQSGLRDSARVSQVGNGNSVVIAQ